MTKRKNESSISTDKKQQLLTSQNYFQKSRQSAQVNPTKKGAMNYYRPSTQIQQYASAQLKHRNLVNTNRNLYISSQTQSKVKVPNKPKTNEVVERMGPLGPQRQLRSAMEPASKSKCIQISKTVQQKKKPLRADSSNFDEEMQEHKDLHINYTSLSIHSKKPLEE